MPVRSRPSSGPSSGSAEMNRTAAGDLAQVVGAVNEPAVLDAHAHPHVRRPRQRGRELGETLVALGQDLEDVPVGAAHHVEDRLR